MAPKTKINRRPILQEILRNIREPMEMESERDRVLWSLWIVLCKGMDRRISMLRPGSEMG